MYFLQLKCKHLTCGSDKTLEYILHFFPEYYLNYSNCFISCAVLPLTILTSHLAKERAILNSCIIRPRFTIGKTV
jgi:hypothetical protein